jgi:hypothetical protein
VELDVAKAGPAQRSRDATSPPTQISARPVEKDTNE